MINRDSYSTSIWQASSEPYTSKKPIAKNTSFDVIIAGGGITGLSSALLLQEAGKKCLVLEAKNLCFGTTGGTTAHLNTLLDTPYSVIAQKFSKADAKTVADAAAAALNLIRSNIKKYSIDCDYEDAVAYLFAQDEKQEKELQEIVEASADAGLDIKYDPVLPLPIPFTKTAVAGGQAKFNPVKYVYGLAQAFETAGGVIVQDCRITAVKNNDRVEVHTSNGMYDATDIIYATHIPPGINLLHLRCSPYRTYAMAVTLQDDDYPKALAYDMLDPYHYYRSQWVNGQQYLIAGGKDHKTGQEENTDYIFTKLEATIRENFMVDKIAYKWSSQYFEPADGLPYIGHLPGHPEHIYVATGFGGNGMTYSHIAAETLCSMLLNKESPLIELFNPNRIKPIAGFSNFITHNTGVISNFAGKLFSAEKLPELADLATGEGRIVKYEGEKIGLYKDEYGNLHAVNPVCTHMKCEVTWNGAEHSWDCPCHGARYDCDGKVITGPADLSLEMINIPELENKQ
jgi:glycine/D-amino acid oxidase-like deaminating enzyme/nitrite reductase/ring-hydroxylating ferredoxin subunit